jgi:hypothetical protein
VSYFKRKALAVRLALLAEAPGTLTGSKDRGVPFPLLKAKLDKAFSDLVRMTFADDDGNVKCVTCNKTGHWKTFDNGHFVHRDRFNTRWLLDNCRPQCEYDNRRLDGRPYEFGQELNRQLGPGTAERLIALGAEDAAEIRQKAPQMLLDIRAALKIQRKRFK